MGVGVREGEGEFKELSMRAPGTKQELLSVLSPHLPGGSVRARPTQKAAAPRAPPFSPAPPEPTLSQDTSPPPRALVPTAGKVEGAGTEPDDFQKVSLQLPIWGTVPL